jgi:hypothetical protein
VVIFNDRASFPCILLTCYAFRLISITWQILFFWPGKCRWSQRILICMPCSSPGVCLFSSQVTLMQSHVEASTSGQAMIDWQKSETFFQGMHACPCFQEIVTLYINFQLAPLLFVVLCVELSAASWWAELLVTVVPLWTELLNNCLQLHLVLLCLVGLNCWWPESRWT